MPKRKFHDLTEQEILALAIANEEEDARIYLDFARKIGQEFPATAQVLHEMHAEENEHRRRLLDVFQAKYGDHIPLIRREDVHGYQRPAPLWLELHPAPEKVRQYVQDMERAAERFYASAAAKSTDPAIRKLLGDLAVEEAEHVHAAFKFEQEHLHADARAEEEAEQRRKFLLEYVQPGLAGLMDGSVSTLAPLFAAAFATGDSHQTLLVGLAASVGAGISMGFAEALSDDGQLTGRGSPLVRGISSGVMTTLGGIFHTLPYLLADIWVATAVAVLVVVIELLVIAWIRHKFMDSPWGTTLMQVVVGGALVFAAGVLIGQG